ncbi:hypothetical protein [Candidatus Albibeggiatoa sp. nov. NOAA]|uniref:hypothetical protein n=1 Tax=Candidatus Albibeggiatoa sp. nov. NOAA TaxID=3162724 RepID=UPI003303C3D1|nr:hypothetical protein [Thiotrichaceae bacterium]
MLQTLYVIAHTFFKICRLELGPQDLPSSRAFLLLVTATYMCISTIIPIIFEIPILKAILQTFVEVGITFFLTFSLLYMTGFYARTLQTLTAIMGIDVFFHLIAIPILILELYFKSAGIDIGLTQILAILLVSWNLTIYAHILRHALSTEFFVGFVITFIYLLVTIIILQTLFPTPLPEVITQ